MRNSRRKRRERTRTGRNNPGRQAIQRVPSSAGRHDAVDMRMMVEVLAPGVEHGDEADPGAAWGRRRRCGASRPRS